MPTEKGALLMLALTVVTTRVFRSTTERLLLPLFATTARFRTVSTATPVGDVPTGIEATQTAGKVIRPAHIAGGGAVRAINVMELVPLLATTAMPVAVFTATAPGRGFVPGMVSVVTTDGAVTEGEGCTARFATATGCAAPLLRTATENSPGVLRSPFPPPMVMPNWRLVTVVARTLPSNSAVTTGEAVVPK